MSNSTPMYKFASLRSVSISEADVSTNSIIIETPLIIALTNIIDSNDDNATKLTNYNNELQAYIDGGKFIKTLTKLKAIVKDLTANPTQVGLDKLYDNIIVRSLTKSNTNKIYIGIIDLFKSVYDALNNDKNITITIPESISPSFLSAISARPVPPVSDENEKKNLLKKINKLAEIDLLITAAEKQNIVEFTALGTVKKINIINNDLFNYFKTDEIVIADAISKLNEAEKNNLQERSTNKVYNRKISKNEVSSLDEELSKDPSGNLDDSTKFGELQLTLNKLKENGELKLNKYSEEVTTKYNIILETFSEDSLSIKESRERLREETVKNNKKTSKLFKQTKYSYIANKWVDTTVFLDEYNCEEKIKNLLENSGECNLKIPYQIADLRVVEKETVGYLPGEIAHINNTQAGEKNTRVTRRLKKSETFDSLFVEDETFRETDTQSTEKFSLETEASNVQAEANNLSVSGSVSATYGPVSASVNSGYSSSSSSLNANSTSQSEAKEIVERVVDRVSKRVRIERSSRITEEFEEIITHEIDNTNAETKSYVYRWLNKLIRGTLKNYGKRLIFELDVAHPASYYLSRSIQDFPAVSLPPNPREASVNGNPVLTINNITRDNYLAWAEVYKTQIEQPPLHKIIVSEAINGTQTATTGKLIPIPKNYECKTAKIISYNSYAWESGRKLVYTLGQGSRSFWLASDPYDMWGVPTFWLDDETENIPFSISAAHYGFYTNIEIYCQLTDSAYQAWKIQAFNTIIDAYEQLKTDADEQMAAFDPNLPGINPAKKDQLIKDELKKGAIKRMFKCNPFWVDDCFVVGKEYDPNCCLDTLNAEKVRFLETVFDWKNMTYQFHPYFYANKNNWSDLLNLSDDDPHFESFLQASFTTIRIPVHRDKLKETAAINFIQNNSIANHEVVPEGAEALLQELDDAQPSLFTVDIDGNDIPVPTSTVDLGIFKIPTNLVMLECGNTDGIKPIGYPQSTDDPTSDVIIPKQYSPAIIADSCDPIV